MQQIASTRFLRRGLSSLGLMTAVCLSSFADQQLTTCAAFAARTRGPEQIPQRTSWVVDLRDALVHLLLRYRRGSAP
jgi:hypothetical protein